MAIELNLRTRDAKAPLSFVEKLAEARGIPRTSWHIACVTNEFQAPPITPLQWSAKNETRAGLNSTSHWGRTRAEDTTPRF